MNHEPDDHGACRACGFRAQTTAGGDPCAENEYGGIDPCLPGFIPGVSAACCGHGDLNRAYVQLGGAPNDSAGPGIITLRGTLALAFFGIVREALRHGERGCPDTDAEHGGPEAERALAERLESRT